jgi:DNA-binding response OmpR family regulator
MRAVHLAPPEAVGCRLDALAAGFDDALATTVPPAELDGRLRWLDARVASSRVRETVLQITPDLVLDLEAHALWRGDVQVHLRPKEYALLRLLASNPGKAMSRHELLSSVWGPDRSADSRTVDVHVRWLRAKIEPDPDRAVHLVTVRGVGYRLDPPR